MLRDEAAYLGLSELVELCTAELRRNPNVYLTQIMRTPSHVHGHTRGASHGSMRSMGTVRERDEDNAGADADIGSNSSTGRDSIGSVKSSGSPHGRGRSRSNASAVPAGPGAAVTATPTPASTNGSKEPAAHPTPSPLLRRRLNSQSRERPELIEVKSALLRGRPSGNWL